MPTNRKRTFVFVVVFLVAMLGTAFITIKGRQYWLLRHKADDRIKFEQQIQQEPDGSGFNTPKPVKTEIIEKPEQKAKEFGTKRVKEIKAKAIYLTGSSAGDQAGLERKIKLIEETELNAVVLDIKDDGKVNYESAVPMVRNNLAYHKLYNVEEVIKKLHDNGIYVIGRIVCFRDPVLAEKRMDLAIKKPNGQLWRENGRLAWTNPYNQEVWKYNIDIAKEAAGKGFDEIQFDYVRFPAAKNADVDFGQNLPQKSDAIGGFLKTAQDELHTGQGVFVSADIFGIVCESPGDTENIGQDLERVGKDIDYICPMLYPSHYANAAQNGSGQNINGVLFTAPDLKPYDVVYQSLLKGKSRIGKIEGYQAKIRPYLQDFTALWLPKGSYQRYGQEQVRQQIKAVYDAGLEEWILWDADNTYTEAALQRE